MNEDGAPKVSEPWRAQPGPQLEAIKKHWVDELFFGGAVGGGKSDYLLGDFAQDVPRYGNAWHGVLFRRSYPQLEELVTRSKMIYPAWFMLDPEKAWTAGNTTWRFPNGATLKFRHADQDDAWMAYQGHQYGWMGYDELPHWSTPTFYRQMKTRLRSAAPIPNKRIRATGNPGGLGHGWIKAYFGIDRYPLGAQIIEPDIVGGGKRMFIRSKVTDNKILLENDPGYIGRLADIGSATLVQQYLDGDWNVIAGAYFPEFKPERHCVKPFPIPEGWMRFRGADWGSAKPFCVLWVAVSDGNAVERGDGTSVMIPRGALVVYREWYGVKVSPTTGIYEADVGLKLTAEEVADGILKRENEKINMSVADPAMFKEDGGPSITQRMSQRGVYFQKADNSRKAGWDAVRARLKGDDWDGEKNVAGGPPMIYFFTNCEHTIRTLPELQHDTGRAAGAMEDVDTHSEDHAGDTVRYVCMARPWVAKGKAIAVPTKYTGTVNPRMTFNELRDAATRRRKAAQE